MTMSDQALTRDRPIVKGRAALLIIDVQNGVIGPAQATSKPEFHAAASARVIPNIRRLLDAFRAAHLEVIYTMIENLTEDGRDCSLDYKLSSFNIAKGSWEAHIIDEIAPQSEQEARSRWTLTGLLSAWGLIPATIREAFPATGVDSTRDRIGCSKRRRLRSAAFSPRRTGLSRSSI